MRSLAMCEAILNTHETRVTAARQRHLEAVAAADKELAAKLRQLEIVRASALADKARIGAAQRSRSTNDGPYVLRKNGEFYTQAEHWVAEPDETRHKIARYAYRAVAERQANMLEFAEVRTWAQYQQELEERRHGLGAKPVMPDADPTDTAVWEAYEAAAAEWERKKFLAGAK